MSQWLEKIKNGGAFFGGFMAGTVALAGSSFDEMATKTASQFKAPFVTTSELKKTMNKSNLVILDARELKEFNVSHLPGARHIGYDNFNIESLKGKFPKAAQVVVYCSVGYRSGKVADQLLKNGYKVKNLRGGIFAWANEEKALIDRKGKPTTKIHGFDKKWSKWLTKGEITY